jgi:LPXTG-motif cell wall-anchored protein
LSVSKRSSLSLLSVKPSGSGDTGGVQGVASIVLGVLMLAGAPFLYRRRNNPSTQRNAGLGRGTAGLSSSAPRSAPQITRDVVVAVIFGIAFVAYGIATL